MTPIEYEDLIVEMSSGHLILFQIQERTILYKKWLIPILVMGMGIPQNKTLDPELGGGYL